MQSRRLESCRVTRAEKRTSICAARGFTSRERHGGVLAGRLHARRCIEDRSRAQAGEPDGRGRWGVVRCDVGWRGFGVTTRSSSLTTGILTTGIAPFDGSVPQLMTAHVEQRPARPTWLAQMPPALERLILRGMAKQPADRPSMAVLARELHALAD